MVPLKLWTRVRRLNVKPSRNKVRAKTIASRLMRVRKKKNKLIRSILRPRIMEKTLPQNKGSQPYGYCRIWKAHVNQLSKICLFIWKQPLIKLKSWRPYRAIWTATFVRKRRMIRRERSIMWKRNLFSKWTLSSFRTQTSK